MVSRAACSSGPEGLFFPPSLRPPHPSSHLSMVANVMQFRTFCVHLNRLYIFDQTCIPLKLGMSDILLCVNLFFLHIDILFSSGRGYFLVLSAPGHGKSPFEHQGASVRPGRGPWHVFWVFKVARNDGETFRARRVIQAHAYRLNICPTAHVICRILNAGSVVTTW